MAGDDEVVIGSFPKNKREQVRVTLSKYKGYDLVGLRVWFKSDDGSYQPGKSGFSIRTPLLPELMRLLDRAHAEAAKRGLLNGTATKAAAEEEPQTDDLRKIVDLLDEDPGAPR
jgi:Transcriptional Coactivator p15 (PC4)